MALEMVWSNPRVTKLGYGLWLGLPRETSMMRFLMWYVCLNRPGIYHPSQRLTMQHLWSLPFSCFLVFNANYLEVFGMATNIQYNIYICLCKQHQTTIYPFAEDKNNMIFHGASTFSPRQRQEWGSQRQDKISGKRNQTIMNYGK